MPLKLEKISFNFILIKKRYNLQIDRDTVNILASSNMDNYIKAIICGKEYIVPAGKWKRLNYPVRVRTSEI
jgi:hypothetical protein